MSGLEQIVLVIAVIAVALTFDFINGFHDAANSIATVVATRVLTPLQAVVWAAFFNFISAVSFGTGVAKTVGAGLVDLREVTVFVILCGLLGAIAPVGRRLFCSWSFRRSSACLQPGC